MPRLHVRIYTERLAATESHSFLVATDQGGLSGRLGSIMVEPSTSEGQDENVPTLRKLRSRIQEEREGKNIKRTSMFEEMLFVMRTCGNPYKVPEEQHFQYRLGRIELDGIEPKEGSMPILYSEEEEEFPLFKVFNSITHDLVVIPLTQIHPDGNNVLGTC